MDKSNKKNNEKKVNNVSTSEIQIFSVELPDEIATKGKNKDEGILENLVCDD